MTISPSSRRRSSRTTQLALLAGVLWSIGLVIAALTAPMYSYGSSSSMSTAESTSSGYASDVVRTSGTATFFQVNGTWGLVVAAIPLLAALIVGFLLICTSSSRGARLAGWTVTGLADAFNVLAMLSIGVYFVPATMSLLVAMWSAARRSEHETRAVDTGSP